VSSRAGAGAGSREGQRAGPGAAGGSRGPGRPGEHADPLRDLGAFIREQRALARLSLRRLSELAGISNPYLSQIERGLRRPSAEILQQIARGLRISAETLYVRAGILDERPVGGSVEEAILADSSLSEEQKATVLHVYRSFRAANQPPQGPTSPGSRSG
jgi:transcriptional regulator with XRE-family HTH domain